MNRPFPWEALYPPGLSWDAPLRIETLPELLDRVAAEHGERPAVEFRDARISYRELRARADRLAAGLLALGIGPGQSVALYVHNTPYHLIAFFAILRAGARVVHLSPLDPPRLLARKMADSESHTIVTTNLPPMLPNALQLLAEGHAERLVVGEDEALPGCPGALPVADNPRVLRLSAVAAEPPSAWPALDAEEVALLQYTGGTTGAPRAAMLSHRNLTAAVSIYDAFSTGTDRPLTRDDRLIVVLPLFHIFALSAVALRGLSCGAELLLRPRFDVETTLRDIEEKRATIMSGVPTMWIALANHPGIERRDLSSLRFAASGGAALPHEVAQRWEAMTGLRMGGGWGMTETSPAGSNLMPGRTYGPGAIGVPLPRIEMDIAALDDPSRTLPPGETGEIRIRGPNVTRGYWKRPEETHAAFVDGWFLTGDIGVMSPEGEFTLVDRKKDMIISGGFNVYPRAIEEAIHEHPSVQEAAVIGVPDPYRGQSAKAFVVLRPGAAPFTLEELRAFLSDKLGRHELPAALELREALPKTPVGKLAKRDLIEEETRARARQREAPAEQGVSTYG